MSNVEGNRQSVPERKRKPRYKRVEVFDIWLREDGELQDLYNSRNSEQHQEALLELQSSFDENLKQGRLQKRFFRKYEFMSPSEIALEKRNRMIRRTLLGAGALLAVVGIGGIVVEKQKQEGPAVIYTSDPEKTTSSQPESTAPPKIEVTPLTGTLKENIGSDPTLGNISQFTATLQPGDRLILALYKGKQCGGAFVSPTELDGYLKNTAVRTNVWDGNTFFPKDPVPSEILIWPAFDQQQYPKGMSVLLFFATQEMSPSYDVFTTRETDSTKIDTIFSEIKAAKKLGSDTQETKLITLAPTNASDAGLSLNSSA